MKRNAILKSNIVGVVLRSKNNLKICSKFIYNVLLCLLNIVLIAVKMEIPYEERTSYWIVKGNLKPTK